MRDLRVGGLEPDSQLVRVIGTRELTASIINVTIASSIFVMPGTVAAGLGAAAPVAYLVCASLMALIALCFAAAGSRVTVTGGLYAYIDIAFGGFAGFIGGFLYWSTACLSVASVATAFAGSLGVFSPALGAGIPRATLLVVLFTALALVNIRGIKPGIRLIEAITAAKLVPLLVLVCVGLWSLNVEYLKAPMPTMSQVGQVSILLIFAFVGVEVALTPSGEVRDSARTVPRAILSALSIATVIYIAVQTVAQGVLGPDLPMYKDAPLAETAGRLLGDAGRLFLLAGGTISIFGYVAGDMLGTPRALLALARDGVLPRAIATVHPRYRTPAVAIVIYACVVAALAISSTFETARHHGERISPAAVSIVCGCVVRVAAARRSYGGRAIYTSWWSRHPARCRCRHSVVVDAGDWARVADSGACTRRGERLLRAQSPVCSEDGFRFLAFAGAGPVTSLEPGFSWRSASSQSSRSAPCCPPRRS